MQRNAIIFLLTCFICGDCLSQQYPFIHYTPKDGLVSNRGRFMFQDSKGLLYISTFDGVSVYDGSRFTNYTTGNGLASSFINEIVEMGDDSIWLMPNAPKINCIVRGRIKEVTTSDGFYPVVNKMIRRGDGSYYALADEGLFRFEKNHFTRVRLADSSGKDAGCFFDYGIETKNKLLIVTDPEVQSIGGPGRLIIFDPNGAKVTISKSVFAFYIFYAPNGDILLATDQGVKKIDEVALQQNKIRLVPLPPVYQAAKDLLARYIYADQQGNLWLCTSGGLIKIDPRGQSKVFSVENGLPVNNLVSVFQDRENIMWFINEQTGISKLTNPNFEFYSQIKPGFFANDLSADSSTDSVWFMDDYRHNLLLQYGKTTKLFQLNQDLVNPPYRCISIKGDKHYLSDLFTIYQGNPHDRHKFSLTPLYAETTRNANLAFSCLIPDGYGNLVASSDNIIVMRPGRKSIAYPLGYLADALAMTPDNYLWVVTRAKKLFKFRIHPENPDHYLELLKIYSTELPEMGPRSIAADQQGNVWIGTRDRGLFCFSFDGLTLHGWKQVSSKQGLSDNFISYLHIDADNTVWACSPVGLDKIRLKDGKILIENITLSNNIYQHIVKVQTARAGVHWVVAESGIIKIIPGETPSSNFLPKITFREISEGRNRIDPSSGTASFSYKKNNIGFTLAVPSFIDEKQTRFSYLLEGSSNKSWSDPASQSVLNFDNLAPGRYTLRAKASFVNHRYPDSEIHYSFVIYPPWWQTQWFRTGWVSLIILIAGLTIRNYYKRKLRQQRMQLEKQQAIEKERSRIATDLHDDLGAGLSTIRFLSEKVKRNTFSDVTKGDIEKMQSASNELIDKMNEIIWSMNETNDSLEDLIFYTRSYAMEYCGDNNLSCNMNLPENIPLFSVSGEIRRNIFLTVKESLHNIVKHASAKNVDIIIAAEESLQIIIKDDGIGLHKNHKTTGGNGFRNMHKRIELIGGDMSIQNGQGMTIILKVPLADA